MRLPKRPSVVAISGFLAVAVQSCLLTLGAEAPGASGFSVINSRLAKSACSLGAPDIRPPTDAPDAGCPGLDALVNRARLAVAGAATPSEIIDRLNRFFFDSERFQVTYDLMSLEHLLPGAVIAGKKGYCVGLATIYLIVAEELDLPIYAVTTPKHVFLRWSDGQFQRNIELFEEGREVLDASYIRDQRIPQASIDSGVFLANLTGKQFLGFIYQNLGVLESRRGEYQISREDYTRAIRLNSKLEAAFYNRGIDELKQKRYREAIRDFTKSLERYPTDTWALWNRGLAWKELGELEKAAADRSQVLKIDPSFHPTD